MSCPTPLLRERDMRTGDPLLPVVGAAMRVRIRRLATFAQQPDTLLIRGMTGTGKSRLARWCHAQSPRRDRPFEVLDLLGVPEDMQAGELFGWKRGAFTGAVGHHDGFVSRAEGGTLFIDEIDKLSMKAQAALLHLLEERRYRVLGDAAGARPADVRFIVGTNADLEREVRQGRFREDLYYRINVLPVTLPALRERRDEIGAWADVFLERREAERSPARPVRFSDGAKARLVAADWPGNLRELDNVVRRAHTLAGIDHQGGVLVVEDDHIVVGNPPPRVEPVDPEPPRTLRKLDELTVEEVLEALECVHYRRARAAALLGISRSSLYAFIASNEVIPRAKTLTREAIRDAERSCAGDVRAMAAELRVSAHGLKLRLQQLDRQDSAPASGPRAVRALAG